LQDKEKQMEPNLYDGRGTLAKAQSELEEMLAKVPLEHRGLLFSRVLTTTGHPISRKLERAFAIGWAEMNDDQKTSPILRVKLQPSDYEGQDPSSREDCIPANEREWAVAEFAVATFMQWLGSAVGTAFLVRSFQQAGGNLQVTLPEDTDE
jgi:hypothetical protein